MVKHIASCNGTIFIAVADGLVMLSADGGLSWLCHETLSPKAHWEMHGWPESFFHPMGEEVEPRRNFIMQHANEVKNLDI